MKRLILFVAMSVIMTAPMMAQKSGEVAQANDVEKGIHKINFIPLTYSYEFRVDEAQTMMIQAGFTSSSFVDEDDFEFQMIFPSVSGNYRYYYNFDKRNSKGLRTARNSANYVGGLLEFSLLNVLNETENFNRYFTLGPVWGMQRNYPKHFSLGLQFGGGLAVGNLGVRFEPIAQLTLGFWLNSKEL